MIRYIDGQLHYYDRNGMELYDGDTVLYESGETQKLYLTENGRLDADATNPALRKLQARLHYYDKRGYSDKLIDAIAEKKAEKMITIT